MRVHLPIFCHPNAAFLFHFVAIFHHCPLMPFLICVSDTCKITHTRLDPKMIAVVVKLRVHKKYALT